MGGGMSAGCRAAASRRAEIAINMQVNRRVAKQLRDGIQAVKKGQAARGRALLRHVLAESGDVEEAWWWLSQAASDPAERQEALQKVIGLNPDHPDARAKLVELRLQQLPAANTGGSAPGAAWSTLLPAVTLEEEDGLDNPFQCPYCGKPTDADDRHCPFCRGSLFRRVAVSGNSETLRRLQLVLGIGLAVGVLELASPVLSLGYRQGSAAPANYTALLSVPGVAAFLGDFLRMAPATSDWLLKLLGVRAAVLVGLILGLRARWRLAYYGAMLVVLGDLLLSVYLLVVGQLGWAGLLLNMAFSASAGLMLFGVSYEFAVNDERLLVRPDTGARGPADFYHRGHLYRRQGMWALAVAQWRKAVGLAPRAYEYYKDLGIGYAQIGRYDRSLRALQEGQRQAPNPAELAEVIALVEAEARRKRARA
jgi:tetratricopeptide (TPR) repeat protein